MRKSVLLACLALPVVVANATGQAIERFTLTGPKVAILNLAGAVSVERGTGTAVVVEVTRGGDDAAQLTIKTGDLEGWRALRVVYPSNTLVYPRLSRSSRSEFSANADGTVGGRILGATLTENGFDVPFTRRSGSERVRISSSGSGLEAYADIRVLVPAGQIVAIELGVGKVDVSNVRGEIRVEAGSGAVAATDVDGPLLIQTGSGSVTAINVTGHARIETGSGGVEVRNVIGGTLFVDTGSGSIDGSVLHGRTVDFETGSGSVRIADLDAPLVRLRTGSGSIRAEAVRGEDLALDTGSGSITLGLLTDVGNARLDTGSGSVTLSMPRELGAELFVDTGSGGIDSNVPLQLAVKKRNSLRGRIGDGSGRIEIDTGSGGVRLRSN